MSDWGKVTELGISFTKTLVKVNFIVSIGLCGSYDNIVEILAPPPLRTEAETERD